MHRDSWNPFDQMEQMFDRLGFGFDARPPLGGHFEAAVTGTSVAVDVAEDDDAVIVTADVPGYEKEDISLSLPQADLLTLRIDATDETTQEADDTDTTMVRRERQHTSLARTLRLPAPVVETDATAEYRNGVLTITLPKADTEDDDSTHIPIE